MLLFRVNDRGLEHIICHYGVTRREVYKRIFQGLWFGKKVGQSVGNPNKAPTYIFPVDMVAEIRKRFPTTQVGAHDKQYQPGDDGAHVVTWEEISSVKWPKEPKDCKLCSELYKP